MNSSNFELVRLRLDQCVSATGLCSGGPRYARSVAILSKGRLPTALWSLDRGNYLGKSSKHTFRLPFIALHVTVSWGFHWLVRDTGGVSIRWDAFEIRPLPKLQHLPNNSLFPSILNPVPLNGQSVSKNTLLLRIKIIHLEKLLFRN